MALAAFYVLAGTMKLGQPVGHLAMMGVDYATNYPEAMTRFIGMIELLGSIALILPALVNASPQLVPLAAGGFTVIQVLAILLHLERGEHFETVAGNLILFSLSSFVVLGRLCRAAPSVRSNFF
ncbi:DoxX family protein [Phyllobacterium brassicacearum]|uniref:DoxX family protein n=1 Tax=Phyllobacterium brassicacearum TaxID=314235 RepID=UPI001414E190|nr:DoxX family protein [Phyllobacterium brassicacearum]